MGVEKIIFYIVALIMVSSATMVITVRNPIQAALFLVLTFFASAIIWMLLEAEFLAIVLVLVYVGAVMVLFLFVVMMLDINVDRLREGFTRYLPIGVVVAVAMVGMLITVVGSDNFGLDKIAEPERHLADYNNTKALGSELYTKYVYPFEIAAVILLVAIVAAIALTMRRRDNTKYQKPEDQISVKREDRVRMVNMPTEKKK
ncbi:MAG: NADH-quinone oxidoreductase subunit J [Gammaproteobacteria bacterium]|nr:NADH-quinone oxidoreductase subunit J [Gammaproteobacteria bacterium]